MDHLRPTCPGSYFGSVNLTAPLNFGDYRFARTADDPIVVRLFRAPLDPRMRGQSAPDQWRAARADLLTTTFETFEYEIRDQLERILSSWGFVYGWRSVGSMRLAITSRVAVSTPNAAVIQRMQLIRISKSPSMP